MKITIDEIRSDGTGVRVHVRDGRFLIEVYTPKRSGIGLQIESIECDGWDLDLLHEAVGRMQERYLAAIAEEAACTR
ncbi:MAG: hypothetical protein ACYCRD_10385 [Leptospirillum sp.]